MLIRDIIDKNVIKIEGNGNCWLWEGNVGNHGYGRIMVGGYPVLVHRFVYELHNGIIPGDKGVLHKCGNRLCANPEHLYLGTAQDNARDWIESRAGHILSVSTLQKHNQSMCEVELEAIKNALVANDSSRTKAAQQLGISSTTLWRKMKKYGI